MIIKRHENNTDVVVTSQVIVGDVVEYATVRIIDGAIEMLEAYGTELEAVIGHDTHIATGEYRDALLDGIRGKGLKKVEAEILAIQLYMTGTTDIAVDYSLDNVEVDFIVGTGIEPIKIEPKWDEVSEYYIIEYTKGTAKTCFNTVQELLEYLNNIY